jgi:hypothetical protein
MSTAQDPIATTSEADRQSVPSAEIIVSAGHTGMPTHLFCVDDHPCPSQQQWTPSIPRIIPGRHVVSSQDDAVVAQPLGQEVG